MEPLQIKCENGSNRIVFVFHFKYMPLCTLSAYFPTLGNFDSKVVEIGPYIALDPISQRNLVTVVYLNIICFSSFPTK